MSMLSDLKVRLDHRVSDVYSGRCIDKLNAAPDSVSAPLERDCGPIRAHHRKVNSHVAPDWRVYPLSAASAPRTASIERVEDDRQALRAQFAAFAGRHVQKEQAREYTPSRGCLFNVRDAVEGSSAGMSSASTRITTVGKRACGRYARSWRSWWSVR